MRSYVIILSIFLLESLCLKGQTRLSVEQEEKVLVQIDKCASEIESMKCDFIQTKSLKMLRQDFVSKGMLYFQSPSKLRWQYVSPYDYTFVQNGNKIRIHNSKSVQRIDADKNKLFKKISSLIFQCLTGEGLRESKDFNVEIYESGNLYYARLYPKKKEIRQVYRMVEIYFNQKLDMVDHIRMEESSGDFTLIELKNTSLNTPLMESLFRTE